MTILTDFHEAIVAADEIFMATYSRGDVAGMASLYTERCQVMPPNSNSLTGKPAIQSLFQTFMDMGIKIIKLKTVEVEGYGETAFEVGKYTLEGERGQVLDQGKYIVIWKQEAGQWKLHRDIFNSSLPAPK
ncbi:MAG: DUF4440 domain-containing protein [Proteobacteria bacterium]|nr:DUF4440 domain-containing protein [Pseudomonadota bacterium]